ncbi:hypothetical protein GJR96_08080 [Haloferax sp. MBLA0076]|uniref:Uncharacterized protein n=1 Tax=Haloferax litoreum TaxID=2666140 RepID=A0A6A8GFI1_9EURY|nr:MULTISPECIES: hypothetical protein [Haloferax]KAB1193402.1 hypothetical protein Hfx1148_08075 [Haloferax sp. CBA1148]MRX21913.1 hypothetical protein [Haloferax litoreum]
MNRRTVLKTAALGLGGGALSTGVVAGSSRGTTQTETRTLTLAANGPVEYTLTVDGNLEPDTDGGDFSADGDEEVQSPAFEAVSRMRDETGPIENAGGTRYLGDRYLVSGIVEVWGLETNGYDVHFYVDGSHAGSTHDADDDGVLVDDVGEFRPDRSVMITANGPIAYELWTPTTEVSPDTDSGDFSADSNDTPTDNGDGTVTVTDETGPIPDDAGGAHFLGDRYRFSGSIEEFDLQYDASRYEAYVYIDERTVDPVDVRNNVF